MTIERQGPTNQPPNHERLQYTPSPTYGMVLFSAGPEYWNPSRSHPTGNELKGAIRGRLPVDTLNQWYLVSALADVQRGEKEATPQDITNWIQGQVVPLFESIQGENTQEASDMKDVLKRNFGLSLERQPGSIGKIVDRRTNTQYLTDVAQKWWKTYFKDGSHVGDFISDLTKDLAEQDISSRIELADSFALFHLFGKEETVAFIKDAVLGTHNMKYAKELVAQHATLMGNSDFYSDAERHAFEMAWELHNLGADSSKRETRQEALTNYMSAHGASRTASKPNEPEKKKSEAPPKQEEPPAQPQQQPSQDKPFRLRTVSPAPGVTVRQQAAEEGAVQAEKKKTEEPKKPEQGKKPTILTDSKTIPNPDHPAYCADVAFSKSIANGESFVAVAVDGVGRGKEHSAVVAKYFEEELGRDIPFDKMPTIKQGEEFLLNRTERAAARAIWYRAYAKEKYNPPVDVISQVGAVATETILCQKNESVNTLVILNFGDARTMVYDPSQKKVHHVTVDHSLVREAVREGRMTADQAFISPNRNQVTKTASLPAIWELNEKREKDQSNDELFYVDIPKDQEFVAICLTDGLSDKIPPPEEETDFNEAYQYATTQGTFNPHLFNEYLLGKIALRERDNAVFSGVHYTTHNDDKGIAVAYYKGQ